MKIDPATFADGLADIVEKVVRPLRDEIAATRGVRLLPHDAEGLGEDLGTETRKQIERAISPLLARLSALENRPALNFRGVFDPSEEYQRGDAVTDANAIWFCVCATGERPGKSSSWRLMLKAAGR